MVRKIGGFTFQELNLTMDDIKAMAEAGADLSYDFVTRPAYHHALVTGDTEFLRLTLRHRARARHRPGVARPRAAEPRRAHARARPLLDAAQATTSTPSAARRSPAATLAERVRADAHRAPDGRARAVQPPFTTNGIACTTATVIAATLGIRDLEAIDAERDASRSSRSTCCSRCSTRCQPGVFALSGWDLVGMLTARRGRASRT